MIGTSYEMVFYLTHDSVLQRRMRATRKYFTMLRKRSLEKSLQEADMNDFLTDAGCVMVRPSVIVPSVYVNEKGRVFDERSLVLYCYGSRKEKNADVDSVLNGGLPSESCVNALASRLRLRCLYGRHVLPSVWDYEPLVPDWIPEDAKEVSRIIGCPLPQLE